VIINRADLGDDRVLVWCAEQQIPVLLSIPFDRGIAEGYARGVPMVESRPELRPLLLAVLKEVQG
jgi:MinD superfamily P-loop ATPase